MNDGHRAGLTAISQRLRNDHALAKALLTKPDVTIAELGVDDATAERLRSAIARANETAQQTAIMRRARQHVEEYGDDAFAGWSLAELKKLGAAAGRLFEMTDPRSDEVLQRWGGTPDEWHERFVWLRETNRQWARLAGRELRRRGTRADDDALRGLDALAEA